MTTRRILTPLLGLVLMLSACGDDDEVGSTASSALDVASSLQQTASSLAESAQQAASSVLAGLRDLEGEWVLGADVLDVDTPDAVRPTITFEGTDVSGFAGCNTYTGQAQIDGNRISLVLAKTAMACDGPGQVVEDAYFERLNAVETFVVAADRLVLTAGVGTTLVYTRP
jgi:heat shock protein HslJ